MAGEMSREEVTRENYPDLFALMDELKAAGIESEPRPFDQYQGPYLYVPGVCSVWYVNADYGPAPTFCIEVRDRHFDSRGADFKVKEDATNCAHGVYYGDSAALRIAQLARKAAKR